MWQKDGLRKPPCAFVLLHIVPNQLLVLSLCAFFEKFRMHDEQTK
jgi:hypothetical protein